MAAYGSRNVGDLIDGLGIIERVSLTAYLVNGQWHGFATVDGTQWAEPLIADHGIQTVVKVMARQEVTA